MKIAVHVRKLLRLLPGELCASRVVIGTTVGSVSGAVAAVIIVADVDTVFGMTVCMMVGGVLR